MSWIKVQEVSSATTTPATSLAVTIAAPVAGNLLVALIQATDNVNTVGNEAITGVTQTNTTWTNATSGVVDFHNMSSTSIFSAVAGSSAGATVTIACSNGDASTSNISVNITEWSGGQQANVLDTAATTTNPAGSSAQTTSTITVARPSELVLAASGPGNSFVLSSTGWTGLTETNSSGGAQTAQCWGAYKLAGPASESETATWTSAIAVTTSCIAAFIAPASMGSAPVAGGHYRVWTMINRK